MNLKSATFSLLALLAVPGLAANQPIATPFISGQLVVKLKAGVTNTEFAKLLKQLGLTKLDYLLYVDKFLLQSVDGEEMTALNALQASPLIESVSLNKTTNHSLSGFASTVLPGDSTGEEYGINHYKDFGITKAWQYTTGKGVKLGLIDIEFDLAVPDLKGQAVNPRRFEDKKGVLTDDDNVMAYAGEVTGLSDHGTAVSSILIGANNGQGMVGVAFDAQMVPVVAGERIKSGALQFSSYSISKAYDHFFKNGVNIINMSISCGLTEEHDFVVAHDMLIIASATNANNPLCDLTRKAAKLDGSANKDNYDNYLYVAAVENKPNYPKVSYSGYGESIELLGPTDLLSAGSNFSAKGQANNADGSNLMLNGGTSATAPFISGIAGLMKSASPHLKAPQLKALLKSASTKTSTSVCSYKETTKISGLCFPNATVIDAEAAVLAAINADQDSLVDIVPPVVSFVDANTLENTVLHDLQTFNVTATDHKGIAKVAFYVDDTFVGEDLTAPYQVLVNMQDYATKTINIEALAVDINGNQTKTPTLRLTSGNSIADNLWPTIDRISLSGTPLAVAGEWRVKGDVKITVSAYDNVGVNYIGLFIDGQLKAATQSFEAEFTWNSFEAGGKTVELIVVVNDAAGNVAARTATLYTTPDAKALKAIKAAKAAAKKTKLTAINTARLARIAAVKAAAVQRSAAIKAAKLANTDKPTEVLAIKAAKATEAASVKTAKATEAAAILAAIEAEKQALAALK